MATVKRRYRRGGKSRSTSTSSSTRRRRDKVKGLTKKKQDIENKNFVSRFFNKKEYDRLLQLIKEENEILQKKHKPVKESTDADTVTDDVVTDDAVTDDAEFVTRRNSWLKDNRVVIGMLLTAALALGLYLKRPKIDEFVKYISSNISNTSTSIKRTLRNIWSNIRWLCSSRARARARMIAMIPEHANNVKREGVRRRTAKAIAMIPEHANNFRRRRTEKSYRDTSLKDTAFEQNKGFLTNIGKFFLNTK